MVHKPSTAIHQQPAVYGDTLTVHRKAVTQEQAGINEPITHYESENMIGIFYDT